MDIVKHEKSAARKKKSVIQKKYNVGRVQHEESATRKKFNM